MGQNSSKQSTSTSTSTSQSSILEGQLSRGEWDKIRIYLKSSEGCNELIQNKNGLISYQGRTKIITPPLWTAIFHHAPIDIVKTIYSILLIQQQQQSEQKTDMKYDEKMKKSELLLLLSIDLLHVALESSSGPNDKRRQYNDNDPKEYFNLIKFLLERCVPSSSSSSSSSLALLSKTCTFKEAKIQKQYTPLGHAISNRRVSSDIVQYLCFICPDAIDIDCTLVDDGNEYDISTFALSIGRQNNNNSNNNNNDKRDLILRGSDFYKQEFSTIDTTSTLSTIDETTDETESIVQELPPPNNSAIERALRTVANYGEWNAVKNILPLLTYSNSNNNNNSNNNKDDEKENNEKEQPDPEPLWVTDIRNEMDNYFMKKERTKEMDIKLRKYFGLVMYDVDIIVDLFSTVVPKRKRNNKRNDHNRSHALDQRRNDNGGKMM
jgi:hypothetical protein